MKSQIKQSCAGKGGAQAQAVRIAQPVCVAKKYGKPITGHGIAKAKNPGMCPRGILPNGLVRHNENRAGSDLLGGGLRSCVSQDSPHYGGSSRCRLISKRSIVGTGIGGLCLGQGFLIGNVQAVIDCGVQR